MRHEQKIPCVLNMYVQRFRTALRKQIETKVCKEQGLAEIYGGSRIGKEDNDKKDKKVHTSKK